MPCHSLRQVPQHPKLMIRKHGDRLPGGNGRILGQPAHQHATLIGQGASYLPPIPVAPIPPHHPPALQAVQQSGDPRRALDKSRRNFEGRQSITTS